MDAQIIRGRADRLVKEIKSVLDKSYPPDHKAAKGELYRYNSASVRIRITDPKFVGMDMADRENIAWRCLNNLKEEDHNEITMLLVLAPGEESDSFLNLEFDDPTPSRL